MRIWLVRNTVLVLLTGLLLTSLGGCSGDVATSALDGGGIGGTGISFGSITAFGSIFVNGVEFDTSNAEVIVEGEQQGHGDQAARDSLEVGMVVRVEGSINDDGTTGTSSRVVYNDNVEGPVERVTDIDANTKEILVLNQTVIMDDHSTAFKGTTLSNLAVDDVVEVSGLIDGAGVIHATYIERTGSFTPGMEVELKGIVQNLDTDLETFEIQALTVDYSLADKEGLPGRVPANGMFVEVKGTLDAIGHELRAAELEIEDELGTEDADEVEVKGLVTKFVSVSEFTVGALAVQTYPNTRLKNGLREDIKLGARLEVEGTLVNGVLLADEVSFRDNIKLESNVASITVDPMNPNNGTLVLVGLEGITLVVNKLTEIQGDAITFDQILPDYHVEIRGRLSSGTRVAATKLEVGSSSDTKLTLQGQVDSVSAPNLVILQVTVDTGTVPDDDFRGIDDLPTTRTEFFSTVKAGDSVKAKGRLDLLTNGVTWHEIELEDN